MYMGINFGGKVMKDSAKRWIALAMVMSFLLCFTVPVNAQTTFQNKTSATQQLTTVTITTGTDTAQVKSAKGEASTMALAAINVQTVVSCYDTKIVVQVTPYGLPAGVTTFTGKIIINDAIGGTKVSEISFPSMTLKPYTTSTYTYNKAVSSTVQETVKLDAELRLNGAWTNDVDASLPRYNFVGGKYGTMAALNGQRHHCPAKSVLPSNITEYSGPAIRMLTADHQKTLSYKSSQAAIDYRAKQKNLISQGKLLAAIKMDIDDVNSIAPDGRYSYALNQMYQYAKTLGYTQ